MSAWPTGHDGLVQSASLMVALARQTPSPDFRMMFTFDGTIVSIGPAPACPSGEMTTTLRRRNSAHEAIKLDILGCSLANI